jgi:hypothetical protein
MSLSLLLQVDQVVALEILEWLTPLALLELLIRVMPVAHQMRLVVMKKAAAVGVVLEVLAEMLRWDQTVETADRAFLLQSLVLQ